MCGQQNEEESLNFKAFFVCVFVSFRRVCLAVLHLTYAFTCLTPGLQVEQPELQDEMLVWSCAALTHGHMQLLQTCWAGR